MPTLVELARVLRRYKGRYLYLDVFADDVSDLRDHAWRNAGSHLLGSLPGGISIRADALPGGVLRLSLSDEKPPSALLAAGALGGLIGAATETKGGLLGGLILGVLVGAVIENATQMNRVMTLRFDSSSDRWATYDGPLLPWAMKHLVPST
jgi:hypothetical protein